RGARDDRDRLRRHAQVLEVRTRVRGPRLMAAAIRLSEVSKCYRILRQQPFLAKTLFRALSRRSPPPELHWALRDVSFEIGEGECVGVLGKNGSGKSTLLSLLARTSRPTYGKVEVRGRIGPLLELGA